MKEFIEIPFGAKDSELEGWEYNIPEGYTASIENGKIVVKKEESKNEKIRKEIINYFKCQSREEPSRKDTHNKWIAWLEKVIIPNHNDIDSSFIEDIKEVIADAPLLMQSDKEKMIAWLEKQGEQKPVEWSEEDISKLNKIATTIYEAGEVQNWWRQNRLIDKETANELNDWLKSLKERYTWKPSDDQIAALRRLVNLNIADLYDYRHLKRLLEQLEKL